MERTSRQLLPRASAGGLGGRRPNPGTRDQSGALGLAAETLSAACLEGPSGRRDVPRATAEAGEDVCGGRGPRLHTRTAQPGAVGAPAAEGERSVAHEPFVPLPGAQAARSLRTSVLAQPDRGRMEVTSVCVCVHIVFADENRPECTVFPPGPL